MTEDEAKTKWCPFSQVVQTAWDEEKLLYAASGNRVPASESDDKIFLTSTLCIGSQCMAWRWHSFENKLTEYEDDTKEFTTSHDETFGGYCGLASKG